MTLNIPIGTLFIRVHYLANRPKMMEQLFCLVKGAMRTREMKVELATFTGPSHTADVLLEDVALIPKCIKRLDRKIFYSYRLRFYAVRQLDHDVLFLTSQELDDYINAELNKSPIRERSPRKIIRERRAAFYLQVQPLTSRDAERQNSFADRRIVVLSDSDSQVEARVEACPKNPSIQEASLIQSGSTTVQEDENSEINASEKISNPYSRIVHLTISAPVQISIEPSSDFAVDGRLVIKVAPLQDNSLTEPASLTSITELPGPSQLPQSVISSCKVINRSNDVEVANRVEKSPVTSAQAIELVEDIPVYEDISPVPEVAQEIEIEPRNQLIAIRNFSSKDMKS